jgi:hypothetical protein
MSSVTAVMLLVLLRLFVPFGLIILLGILVQMRQARSMG